MSRVLCVCNPDEADVVRSALATEGDDVDLKVCDPDGSLVDEVMSARPDVLIYELRPDSDADLAVLWLVNHVAPRLPLVVVGEEHEARLPTGAVRRIQRAPNRPGEILGAVQEMLHTRHL